MGWRTTWYAAGTAMAMGAAAVLAAEELAPDRLVQAMTSEVLDAVRAEPELRRGDAATVMRLVDRLVMPHVDMAGLTGLAMGRYWRAASDDQQRRLENEFKTLIVRSYAGALAQVSADQTVETRPLRAAPDDDQVVVSTAIRGRGEPVRIDYRLHRRDGGWKIYDVSVLGVWLAENYRSSFAQEVGRSGIEGLIARMQTRNQEAAGPATPRRSER